MTTCGCFRNAKDQDQDKRNKMKPMQKQLRSDYSSKQ